MTEENHIENINIDELPVNFLIIRLSSIGDIVLTTPVIRCLKQQVPGARVHYLTKREFVPVIAANPCIDQIHEYETVGGTLRMIRDNGFHYIIDLHNNLRTALIKSRLPIISFSFDKLNYKKWLLVNFKKDLLPDVHIVDRYIETLRLFDVANDHKGLDYFIPPSDEVSISGLPEQFHNGYVLFAIGANHATKRLPEEKIISICMKIGLPVILAGGTGDSPRAGKIAGECGDLVFNGCGKYSINQSASLVRQARLVISHDTGLMHIAAAFKKKIISVWGNTVPRFGMYPYMPHSESAVFEVGGLSCRPCTKIGFKKCPKGHFRCMKDQDEKAIAEYAIRIFDGAK
jgi:ADP-heptose:LPS heptosyltransferase